VGRGGKSEDSTVLMRYDATLDTSSPSDELMVNNIHVQKVEKWISSLVKDNMLGFIKSDALKRAEEKYIAERIES
jgi:hypothetical protein